MSSLSSSVSAVTVLAVADIVAAERFLAATFGALLSNAASATSGADSCSRPATSPRTHSLSLSLGNTLIILVTEGASPPLLHSNTQLVLMVDHIDDVVQRAAAAGGKILEESVLRGSVLYVVQSPPPCASLTLVLSERPSNCTTTTATSSAATTLLSSFTNTFSAWCMGELGAASSTKPDNDTDTAADMPWTPPPGPVIPTLFPSVLHNGQFRDIAPNSSAPIPFKTEYFEGEMLLLVRTTPQEPRYKHIFQKVSELTKKAGTITFEVQCQGKFTKIPEGRLYIGAEITKKMNLGIFTRGVCYTVLQFVNSINPFIHSSFGDSNNAELPHITGPLWGLADKIIVTPAGHTPPKLGQILPEDRDARAERRSKPLHDEVVDLASTYSFSVNTDNIELCDWDMVNIPLTNSMDLHTFWADADIRLCCYCVPHDPDAPRPPPINSKEPLTAKRAKALAKTLPKYHYQATNQYLLCVQLEHLSNHPGRAPNTGGGGGEEEHNESKSLEQTSDESYFAQQSQSQTQQDNDGDFEDNDSDNDSVDSDGTDIFFDAMDGNDSYFPTEHTRPSSVTSTRSLRRSMAREQSSEVYNFVPAAVLVSDVVRHRSMLGVGSAQRELYLFFVPYEHFPHHPSISSSSSPPPTSALDGINAGHVTLQSYRDFAKHFDMEGCFKTHAHSRMSRTEQRRGDLQHSLSQVLKSAKRDASVHARLVAFFRVTTHTDYFLCAEKINAKNGKNGVGNPRLRTDLLPASSSSSSSSTLIMEGYVCTRVGQTHWSEEYLCVTAEELIFIQHSPRLNLAEKKRRRIPWQDVLSIRVIDANTASFPLEDSFCLLISTFPREFVVLVRGQAMLDSWLAVLPGLLEAARRTTMESGLPLANSFKQIELFTHPLDWKLGTRVLLNGRKYCGRGIFERPEVVAMTVKGEQLIGIATGDTSNDDAGSGDSGVIAEKGDSEIIPSAMKSSNPSGLTKNESFAGATVPARSASYTTNITSRIDEAADIKHTSNCFPLHLVERALRLISAISVFSNSMENILSWDSFLETQWIEYMDLVSFLPCIDLSRYTLSNAELVCLYLNLYHAMLLHAVLVAGVPQTLLKWPSFFNSFAYEAFGDVFSLSELEHSILKGGFKTTGLIPQIVIRQSKYDIPLPKKDFRLLFAMNCGSLSMPAAVPVFHPEQLEDQLDESVRNCLKQQLCVTRQATGKLFVVRLPLVCQWYQSDVLEICDLMEFSSEYKKATKLLRLFINYCGKEQKDILLELITNDKASYSFKYSKFDFRCRILKIDDHDNN